MHEMVVAELRSKAEAEVGVGTSAVCSVRMHAGDDGDHDATPWSV